MGVAELVSEVCHAMAASRCSAPAGTVNLRFTYARGAPVGAMKVGSVLGSSVTLRVAPAIGAPRVSSAGIKCCFLDPVLVIVKERVSWVFGELTTTELVGLRSNP